MSTSNGNRLRMLTNRAEYLADRIARRDGSDAALGYMVEERKALEWALPILRDLVANARVEARDVHRQRVEAGWRNLAGAMGRMLVDEGLGAAVEEVLGKAPGAVEVDMRRRLAPSPYGALVPPADDTREAERPLWYHEPEEATADGGA